MSSSNTVYCFLDTNILIHYQTFDEVEWTKVTSSSEVVLTLAPVVLLELNQHKDDSSNEWRRKRSRTLVSKLKSLLAQSHSTKPVALKSNTSILDIPNEPVVDWRILGLDPGVNDDRLIAAIIKFKEQHPSDRIVLVSDDFLAQRKAASFYIEVIDPEELIDMVERPSEEAATIRKLEKEIQDLQRRIPEPRLSFWENNQGTNTVIRASSLSDSGFASDEQIAQQVALEQQKLEQIIAKAQSVVSINDIDKFIKKHNDYTKQLERSLKLKRTRDFGLQIYLEFVLQNTGSTPATDLELSLQFPEWSLVVGGSHQLEMEYWGNVKLPKAPVPDWLDTKNPFDFISSTMLHVPPTTQPPEQPKPRGPLYDDKDRSIVWFHTPKLRHKDDWYLSPLVAFLPPETSGGFEIAYSMHADNLINKIDGRLNVVLKRAK